MDVTDTKPLEKCCSKCGNKKTEDKFIPNRNICKECRNAKSRENYKIVEVDKDDYEQECNICSKHLSSSQFIKNRTYCKDCNNEKRRIKYQNDNDHRIKLINQSMVFKQKKAIEKHKIKLEELGEGNSKCNYCFKIKSNSEFRHNRLKCKICERDEPISKIIRGQRSRIHSALKCKSKKTIAYLGCNCREYLDWILHNDVNYTFENHGSEWHIDHVIPVSKFDLENEEEQLIAFNWRNTMALSVKENLSKNSKIIKSQIEQHLKKLIEYHKEKNLDLPPKFIELFAKHLDAGSS